MNIFSVINIDIVNSRKLQDRQAIQETLNNYIKEVNNTFKEDLASSITMTLGDEWQIVLKEPNKSYCIIDKFQRLLKKYNIDIYAGIGIGSISTKIYDDTRLMDGECFVKAREALNISKNNNRFYSKNLNSKKNRIYFNGENINFINHTLTTPILREVAVTGEEESLCSLSINNIINTLIENNEVLKSKITNKQLEIIDLYEKVGSYNNIVKNRPEISKASISQKLNDANYFVINNNDFMIQSLLDLYCKIRGGS
ncbi:SatD family protein [Haloimpatiens sp. FM7330]|uniref:SatD family protein n=1 Tax=Haloimpatiens sp. FM7330 TaxID=3298610 RepID=UPI0036453013